MSRLKLTATSLFIAIALVVSMGVASGGTGPVTPLQESTPTTTDVAAADSATESPLAAITPFAGLVAVSPTEPWLTEVRIPVVVENPTGQALPADLNALGGLTFAVRDSAGTLHGVDGARPLRGSSPSHSLRFVEPEMTARWTLGFRVPSGAATDLVLELRSGTELVEKWRVDSLPTQPNAVPAVNSGTRVVSLGDEIQWGPGLTATPLEIGSMVCGDPTIETVTQVVTVTFEVANSSSDEVRWPGYVHRDGSSIAQWSDGTAADMSMETHVGDDETLPRVSTSAVRVPAMTTTTRAMVFAAPRDGRFADVSALPSGILLHGSAGDSWLDLGGATPTVGLSPAFCDIGFFGGPVPFGFTPGAKFEVGGESQAVDAAALDMAARRTITEALAGAALYYDASGQSFSAVTGEDLSAVAPRITFSGHNVGAQLDGGTGIVFFATRADDDDFLYVATQSATGRWFCAGVTPHQSAIAADAFDLEDISGICFPETTVDEG